MTTIDDIAREAGVSNTTVSNVIHGRAKRVSADTIQRINDIIEKRGYVPNMSARSLASRSSKVVALINHLDPEGSGKLSGDPFFNTLIGAVEQSLREKGYYLMIRAISDSEELSAFLRNWNVDGLFLPGLFEGEDLHATLMDLDLPVVLTDSYIGKPGRMVNVGLQDFEGGLLATRHLIENGHRRIAFACAPIRPGGVVAQRLRGYQAALAEAGIPFDPELVFPCEFSTSGTMELGHRLAERTDLTAIFATADILAAGIMSGLQQSGRLVPRDVSIIGFDDINWCRLTLPMLTTIRQDAKERGRLAAECMTRLLEGEPVGEKNIILPVELVRRDSVRSISE